MAAKKSKKGARTPKSSARKRTLNPPGGAPRASKGAPFSEQDPKRRLGNFEGTGEAARRTQRAD